MPFLGHAAFLSVLSGEAALGAGHHHVMAGSVPSFSGEVKKAAKPQALSKETDFFAEWDRFQEHLKAWERRIRRLERFENFALAAGAISFVAPFIIQTIQGNSGVVRGNTGFDFDVAAFLFWVVATACLIAFCIIRYSKPEGPVYDVKRLAFQCFGLTYFTAPAHRFPMERFERLHLLPSARDFRRGEMIEGEILGVRTRVLALERSELRKTRGMSASGFGSSNLSGLVGFRLTTLYPGYRPGDLFKGALILADYPKPFRGRTIILPKTFHPRNMFSRGLRKIGDPVDIDSDEFNTAFKVYSSDPGEAAQLITSSLIEQLLRLRKPIAREIGVAFEDGQILIACDDKRDWFPDPGDQRPPSDPAYLDDVRKSVEYIGVIVRVLELNGAKAR